MKGEVIIACDFSSKSELFDFLSVFQGRSPYLKVGMELFYKEGGEMVSALKKKGYKIFLDLKLHDIPNTVKKAMKNLALLGADMVNVHAAGGIEMMKNARLGLLEGTSSNSVPLLIAVTQLTSISDETLKNELLIDAPMSEVVSAYAKNVKTAGLDGVVCSPLEAPIINELGLISVTPGIRLSGDDKGDQKRVTTPLQAKINGSTFIVVGRSITAAENPLSAYDKCMSDFCGR